MPLPGRRPSDPDAVNALVRGFELLDAIAAARRPLGNAELSQLTGIPRATVSRLLATLVGLGHVREAHGTSGGYELAAGLVRLAQAFLGAIDIRQHARPHLLALAEACGCSAFVAVRDGPDMLVIEAARARSAVALLGSDVGTRLAIPISALGRAWLAGVDAGTRSAVLASLPDAAPLARTLADTQRLGHALVVGEWHPNINAVAVALCTASGDVVALNCGGPAFVVPADRLQQVVLPRLLDTAAALARDIGGTLVQPAAEPVAKTGVQPGAQPAAPISARRSRTRSASARQEMS